MQDRERIVGEPAAEASDDVSDAPITKKLLDVFPMVEWNHRWSMTYESLAHLAAGGTDRSSRR